jgi:hypothetical protein
MAGMMSEMMKRSDSERSVWERSLQGLAMVVVSTWKVNEDDAHNTMAYGIVQTSTRCVDGASLSVPVVVTAGQPRNDPGSSESVIDFRVHL